MQTQGLSERRGLQVVRMSASALRYEPRPDRNQELRARIVALAQRHRRYGVGMIHLKLRQAGQIINYKRVERLYGLEKLHIRRRRRKKIPASDRQPLVRPGQANEIWSMDFVFDRIASGRTLKCLAIVDDATHEAVDVVPEHTIGGDHLTRIMDGICSQRGKPTIIRTDNVLRTKASVLFGDEHSMRDAMKHRAVRYPQQRRQSGGLPRSRDPC
jgi:transposase InsO family protein